MDFMSAIGEGFTAILGWLGEFAGNLLTSPADGEASLYVMLPVVGLRVGYGVVNFGMSIVTRLIPGI